MNQNQLREYLFQQDLAHEKEMDKLLRDAQPKKIKDDYKLKLVKPPIITRDLITPEYMAEKQLLDLSLDQQMQNMIKKANYAVDGKTPEPMKGSVTEEMIADYKKEVMKPVEIGGKFHLYRPVEIPPIPKPIPKPYAHGGPKITETQFQNELHNMFRSNNAFENALDKLQEDKKALEDRFTFESELSIYNEDNRRAYLMTRINKDLSAELTKMGLTQPKDKNKTNLVNKIIDNERKAYVPTPRDAMRANTIGNQLKQVNADINYCIDEIGKIEDAYTALTADYQDQQDVDEENRLKAIEYENTKRQVAQEVLSDFNRLNQGKTQVVRQSNETDDEFIQRLKDMGNIFIDPADMEKQIQTEILMKAKKNILELTNDYDKAESVLRMLNNNERFQMNKTFPSLKKKYSDTFGLNNKNLDDVEMTQFIKNEVEKSQSLITPKASEPGPDPAPAPAPEATPAIAIPTTKISLPYLKMYTQKLQRDRPELNLTIPKTKAGVIKQLVEKRAWNEEEISAYIAFLKAQPQEAYFADAQIGQPINAPYLSQEDQQQIIQPLTEKISPLAANYVPPDLTKQSNKGVAKFMGSLSGNGLKSQVFPQNFIFGKIAIDLNKLFYQNVLSIKKHNGHKIIGHRNKKVSDNFVEVIFKMIDDKPISQTDLKNIKDERLIYDNLIVQSGLNKSKKIPTTIEQTSQEMKDRLGLIVGEIEAGNSNKKLLEELHELLFKMVRVYLISKSAASTYYNNIKKEFFSL